jgi:hypothetical protein
MPDLTKPAARSAEIVCAKESVKVTPMHFTLVKV